MLRSIVVLLVLASTVSAEPIRVRVFGLFSPDRVDDLREAMKETTKVTLSAVDYGSGTATFEFDRKIAFPGAKDDQIVARLDQLLRSLSHSTFGAMPLSTAPAEKLKMFEIGVGGLDCKACALAAYEGIAKLDGVEKATVSFREGKAVVVVDSAKIERTEIEAALKKRGVVIR